MISREYLLEYFNYDPETGILSVKKPRKSTAGRFREVGAPVGTLTEHGYLKVGCKGKPQYIHRIAFMFMTGEVPDCIDHINGDRTDNRWDNLRGCTKQQNCTNRKVVKSLQGFKGVTKVGKKFKAQMRYKNKQLYIGFFDTAEQAHEAYFQKSKELNGNFATRGGLNA